MTPMRVLFLAAVVLLCAAPAYADGTVMRAKGCGNKIFVSTENSYSVLAASEPGLAADGDTLVGDTAHIGFSSFYDKESGRRFSASIDERGLSKAEATERIAGSCRSQTEYNRISGQVERAEGCRGRIFVDTPQGYAVLELLAGGVIAAGDTLSGDFNKAGRATVTNPKTGGEFVVFVDDFQLSKSAEMHKIAESCRQ
jgi:hypothetical protein